MLKTYLRKKIFRHITGQERFTLENNPPSADDLHLSFQRIDAFGLYLHIPFCRYICHYCPYNKELYEPGLVKKYTHSVLREIDHYAAIAGDKPVTSFYIGGGTPTTMLGNGIETIIGHIYKRFNMKCRVHMESHPNDLTRENLDRIRSIGVDYLSIGVEALQDRHLKTLKRPYTPSEVRKAVERAVSSGFECVNADFIFALPGQTYREIEQAGHELVSMGIQQAATYPLFRFPYTTLGPDMSVKRPGTGLLLKRRKMLHILEEIFYDAGFERSSVWAFTKKGTEKYCSVTVPVYLGLGASGGSYLNEFFYLNTFHVAEYIKSVENNRMPVALSVTLEHKMQMAWWLYWRVYEIKFRKSDFLRNFGSDFDSVYGKGMKLLSGIGFLRDDGYRIELTDKGAYWIHAFEDWFSIDFIGNLWGNSKTNPWPQKVVLV